MGILAVLKTIKKRSLLLAVLGLLLLFAAPLMTIAGPAPPVDCTSPNGYEADMYYDYSDGVDTYRYCDGADWVNMLKIPTSEKDVLLNNGSGGVTNGKFFYNAVDNHVGIQDSTPDVEMDVVGDIHYTGSIVDVSDIRLKKNIRRLDGSLDKITAVQALSYQKKTDPHQRLEMGVSAQQLQRIYPELVFDPDGTGLLSVSYPGLIAPLVDSLQSLKREETDLRIRLQALEQELSELEKRQEKF